MRAFSAASDLGPMVELIDVAFGERLDAQDRMWLGEISALTRLGPLYGLAAALLPGLWRAMGGLVWLEDGRLVGNVSLMRGRGQTWHIANVATHPDYRRKGIARRLTRAAMEQAGRLGAHRVRLQVSRDNAAAMRLYHQLGFAELGALAHLRLPALAPARRLRAAEGMSVAPLSGSNSDAARRLVQANRPPWLGAPRGLPPDGVLAGLRQAVDDALAMRSRLAWVVTDGQSVAGLALLELQPIGQHGLDIVTDPAFRGCAEAPLINTALRSVGRRPRVDTVAVLPTVEEAAIRLLRQVGFGLDKTLVQMQVEIG
jgi:ribosomal protein S18 acetylase RimI-like enzyme